jgi:hypothetical protein
MIAPVCPRNPHNPPIAPPATVLRIARILRCLPVSTSRGPPDAETPRSGQNRLQAKEARR